MIAEGEGKDVSDRRGRGRAWPPASLTVSLVEGVVRLAIEVLEASPVTLHFLDAMVGGVSGVSEVARGTRRASSVSRNAEPVLARAL